MRHKFRNVLLSVFVATFLALPTGAQNHKASFNTGSSNVAINGYDTVAYFTDGKATKGKQEFTFSWNDTQWHFVSAGHRDLFAANPEKYAPQFQGFCAASLTRGNFKVTDPEAWAIVDGKLYLTSSKEFARKFQTNPAENIEKAEETWAKSQQ
jgi:YHS domain-containing protein